MLVLHLQVSLQPIPVMPVLDNLIHRLEIAPLIVAMTTSRKRLVEYAAHPPHERFLAEDLVPAMEQRFPDTETASLIAAGEAAAATARPSEKTNAARSIEPLPKTAERATSL